MDEQELARLRAVEARYEALRRLNVPQFKALYERNLRGEKQFDALVDELAVAMREVKSAADNAEVLNWREHLLKRVKIRWRDPTNDWPYFVVLRVHGPLRSVLLRGMDYPDGSAKHEGDEFWVDMSAVAEFERVRGSVSDAQEI